MCECIHVIILWMPGWNESVHCSDSSWIHEWIFKLLCQWIWQMTMAKDIWIISFLRVMVALIVRAYVYMCLTVVALNWIELNWVELSWVELNRIEMNCSFNFKLNFLVESDAQSIRELNHYFIWFFNSTSTRVNSYPQIYKHTQHRGMESLARTEREGERERE